MKKIIIILAIFIFLCVGCMNNTNNEEKVEVKSEKEKKKYVNYVKELNKVTESTLDLPFDIEINYDEIKGEEVRYHVTIDNPKKEIKNIQALVVHNKQTDDIFPSIGIFDDKVNLISGEKPEGVILVGYIPYEGDIDNFECEIKVLVSYEIENTKYKSYYVTKKTKAPDYNNTGEENES